MARGRGASSPQDREAMLLISKNIRELLADRQFKQIHLSRETGIPASTLTGYIKATSLPVADNIEKIAAFFQVPVAEIDPRYRLIDDIPQQFPELNRVYQQLNPDKQAEILALTEKKMGEQEVEDQLKNDHFPYTVYENYYCSQHRKEQGELVWFDREIDYDIALWIRTDSMEPRHPKNSVALIKETHFEFAGAIYAIEYDGQTIIKRVFNDPTGIRLISLNKKYSDKFIPHDEEPKVIGRVMATFVPILPPDSRRKAGKSKRSN